METFIKLLTAYQIFLDIARKGETMKEFFLALLGACLFSLLIFSGIDREVARRDWVENGVAENCLFDFNCDYYNEKTK